ncbi:kelch-like protein [Corallococcus exercitus]|uniref:Kelch repeat-containing protein n=1 Tax=Corallococcus exercitus TaxID=2316736 RepID=UPI000EA0F880|nr:kelch repeat-containing protein [Corallococcus exercitus]RKG78754.1 kelch-like protein [Corallococcus exercitus]
MKRAFIHLMLTLTAALLAGCGDTSGDTGTARFAVSVPQSLSSDIARVAVASGGPDIRTVWVDLAPTDGMWGGTIGNIPAGTGRAFAARAYDASGTLLFAGSASGVTIAANQTAFVAITLQQLNPPPPFENEAPLIDSLVASKTTVPAGRSLFLWAAAHDPNAGDTLSYAWSATAGVFSSISDGFAVWVAPAATGIQKVTVTVTDSRGLSSSATLSINVQPEGEGEAELSISFNSSPQVSSITATATRLAVGQMTTVSALATDLDGDSLTYAWSASCAGTWADASSSTAGFTPSLLPAAACNNCRLTVSVSDGRGGHNTGTVALCVSTTPPSNPLAPVVLRSYRSSDTASPGEVLTFEVAASDPQGSALTFSWGATAGTPGTPTGDSTHSRITWTAPPCLDVAAPAITVTVTNAFGLAATESFTAAGLPACSTPGTWALTAPRAFDSFRLASTATLLPDGKVLVAGGRQEQAHTCGTAAELYDLPSNTWSATGFMLDCRYGHTATLLPDGKVLVAGGQGQVVTTSTAELYDPATGTWSATGSMTEPRAGHTATLLPNGKVLVQSEMTAELYDPASGTWSPTGSLAVVHWESSATLLPNGKVLVAGGRNLDGPLATVELYDPASGTWSLTGSLLAPASEWAALLPDGKVLVVEGRAAQLYDPTSGTWSLTGSPAEPLRGPMTLLLDGTVLVTGPAQGGTLTTAERYDPASGTWSPTGSMIEPRSPGEFTATLLPDGKVLVVGGSYTSTSSELYTP